MIHYKIGHGGKSIGSAESDNGPSHLNSEKSWQPGGGSPNNATVRYPWPYLTLNIIEKVYGM